jgi:hypothetical protein
LSFTTTTRLRTGAATATATTSPPFGSLEPVATEEGTVDWNLLVWLLFLLALVRLSR